MYAEFGIGTEVRKRSPAEKIDVRIIALIICGNTGTFKRVSAATYGERAAMIGRYSIQGLYICRLERTSWLPLLNRCVQDGIIVWNQLHTQFISHIKKQEKSYTYNSNSKRT